MPLVYGNPYLVRQGSYGTRPYGGGIGARQPAPHVVAPQLCYMEGFGGLPSLTSNKPAFVHGQNFAESTQVCYLNSQTYEEIVLQSDPEAYWRLGESSGTFLDSSGNGWHSTSDTGVYRNQTGIPGAGGNKAVYFDGDFGDRIVFPANVFSGTANFSFEIWIDPRQGRGQDGFVFGKSVGVFQWAAQIDNAGSRFSRKDGGGTDVEINGHDLQQGKWHHVVFTYDAASNTVKAYQDGQLVNTIVGWGTENNHTSGAIYLGSSADGFWGSANAYLDEAAIYARILTPEEVESHFINGLGIKGYNRSGKPAFVYGHGVSTDAQNCYIQSYLDVATDGQPAFTYGHWIITDGQSCYIQIENPITIGPKRAFVRGHQGMASPLKRGYVFGHYAITDGQPAYVNIWTPRLETKMCYIRTPEPLTPSKPAFIRGLIETQVSHNLFTFGVYKAHPTQPAFIRVGEPLASVKHCFLQVDNPIWFQGRAFIRGISEHPVPSQLCFVDCKIPIVSPIQRAFIQIQNPTSSLKRAFVQIQTPMNAGVKRCFIRNVGNLQQPQLAYTNGAFKLSDFQACYIHLPTATLAPLKRAFVEGSYPNVRDGQLCYMNQVSQEASSRICYINGTRIGEVDNVRRAYINGSTIHNRIVGTFLAWINGHIVTKTGFKPCYITSYGLIGDWRLDDGQYDYGVSISNDYSTVNQDGVNVNFPQYVEGPYREDCNDA